MRNDVSKFPNKLFPEPGECDEIIITYFTIICYNIFTNQYNI